MAPQVFDSATGVMTPVDSGAVAGTPVPPVMGGGDGMIFVSVVTYRGTNQARAYIR